MPKSKLDVVAYSATKTYANKSIQEARALIAPSYDETVSYDVGDCTIHDGSLFECISPTSGTWDATKWQPLIMSELLETKADLIEGKVPASELPSFVDDVIEAYYYESAFYKDSEHTEVIEGEEGKIYVDLPNSKSYRYTGSVYVRIDEIDVMTGATALLAGKSGIVPTPAAGDQDKFLKGDGTWDSIDDMTGATALADGEKGLVPKPSTGDQDKVLHGDGTWKAIDTMTGATALADGEKGLVPKPSAGDEGKYLKGDGSWNSIDTMTGATDLTNGVKGLVPAPSAGDEDKFLQGDGTWAEVDLSTMTGATVLTAGKKGLVPAPAAGDQDDVLRGNGTWSKDSSKLTVDTITASAADFPEVAAGESHSVLFGKIKKCIADILSKFPTVNSIAKDSSSYPSGIWTPTANGDANTYLGGLGGSNAPVFVTPDNTPTENSNKLATSGGIYTALSSKADQSIIGGSYNASTAYEKGDRFSYNGVRYKVIIESGTVTGVTPPNSTYYEECSVDDDISSLNSSITDIKPFFSVLFTDVYKNGSLNSAYETFSSGGTVTNSNSIITITNPGRTKQGGIRSKSKIFFGSYSTVIVHFVSMGNQYGNILVTSTLTDQPESIISSSVARAYNANKSNYDLTLDVSSISGDYYLYVYVYNDSDSSVSTTLNSIVINMS